MTENEKSVTYTWKDLRVDEDKEPIVSGWFVSHIIDGTLDEGIPLIDYRKYTKTVPFYFDFQEGVGGPYLRHSMSLNQDTINFTVSFYTILEEQYFQKHILKIPYQDAASFWGRLQNGKITIPFSTRAGDFVWKPGVTLP